MCGHSNWYFNEPYREILFFVPTMQVLLIGPVIYFYTNSLLNNSFKPTWKDRLHFLPGFLYLIYSGIVFVTDKLILHRPFFYADGKDKDLADWYQLAGWMSMIFYAILSIRQYNLYYKRIFNEISYADTVTFRWIKRYLVAFVIMQVLFGIFLVLFPDWGSFSNKWWYYLAFGILSFYIALAGYINASQAGLFFDLPRQQQKPEPESTPTAEIIKENGNPEVYPSLEEWKHQIEELMHSNKLYENARLSLTDLAAKLNTNPTTVSKAINHCFKMNFNDYINNYRVEEIKKMMTKGLHKQQTLLGIAYDAGFNSKTSFNRVFKKNTGKSPKEYLDELNSLLNKVPNQEMEP
jgi:AraC-like DNA-binding protein